MSDVMRKGPPGFVRGAFTGRRVTSQRVLDTTRDFIRERGQVSVGEVQRRFNLTFEGAAARLQGLLRDGTIVLRDGYYVPVDAAPPH